MRCLDTKAFYFVIRYSLFELDVPFLLHYSLFIIPLLPGLSEEQCRYALCVRKTGENERSELGVKYFDSLERIKLTFRKSSQSL